MFYIVLTLLVICLMIYTIIRIVKNRSLIPMAKLVWIAVVVVLPLIGSLAYLTTTFEERHGRW